MDYSIYSLWKPYEMGTVISPASEQMVEMESLAHAHALSGRKGFEPGHLTHSPPWKQLRPAKAWRDMF